jgi:hypothetical protein
MERRGYTSGSSVGINSSYSSMGKPSTLSTGMRRALSFTSILAKAKNSAATSKPEILGSKSPQSTDSTGQEKGEIDFDKIERNLKAFEELYKAWVKYGREADDVPNGNLAPFNPWYLFL